MPMSLPERPPRIPLFARVQASGTTMYAWNLSDGGMYLKAPDVPAQEVPVGRELDLEFQLPDGGPEIALSGHVVWVDASVRDHRGRAALGLGLRFESLRDEIGARIHRFIETFRYRVVMVGFEAPTLAYQGFGDLFQIQQAQDAEGVIEAAHDGHVGLVLLGEAYGRQAARSCLEALVEAPELLRQPPILYCAREADPELESLIVRQGRVSYARLPLDRLELRLHVQRSIESFVLSFENEILTNELRRALKELRDENAFLRDRIQGPQRIEGLVGDSPPMRRLYELVERIAPFSTSVMIVGETGTGKELVARAVHRMSSRDDRPFVAQNCAALTETLLDSELFGHSKGAFTGAAQDRPGIFEAASGGTVFLDEVGEMPPSMQAKLLRVLQDGTLRRVGETKERTVDVRVICATHRDLAQMVKEGTFREDLFYRLRSFVMHLPPLRERREDIAPLMLHFLDRLGERHGWAVRGFSAEAVRILESHAWPGNVRELENTVERLLLLCEEGGKIGAEMVRDTLQSTDPGPSGRPMSELEGGRSLAQVLEEYERQLVTIELERAGGVIAQAARALGMDRTTLSKRLRRLGVPAQGEG